MNRRNFLKLAGFGAAGLAFPGCASAGKSRAAGKQFPNVVYILADDLGYGDVRASTTIKYMLPFAGCAC